MLLLLLSLVWALVEWPAPLVHVRWREGVTEPERRQHEQTLSLANGRPVDGAWRYELVSPRSATVSAILSHRAVQDTHQIDRDRMAISDDAGHGTVRVWWAGPFEGLDGPLAFRTVFGLVALATLVCGRRLGSLW